MLTGAYLLLFPLAFLLVCFAVTLVPLVVVPIIAISYFLIACRHRFYPVLFLILFSRCINGFIVPGNQYVFSAVNLLTGYLPFCIYLLIVHEHTRGSIDWGLLRRYRMTSLYALVLVGYSFIDIFISRHYLLPRVAPMLMLLLTMLIVPLELQWRTVLSYFRITSLVGLVVFLVPGYVERSMDLFSSGAIFGVPVTDASVYFQGTARNMGIFFDFRILGLFATVYLLAALVERPYNLKWLDVALASGVLISTLSRGSIILAAAIVVGLILQRRGGRRLVMASVVVVILALGSFLLPSLVGQRGSNFVSTLNVFTSEDNAYSQRSGFTEYALAQFAEAPWGRGVGNLKVPDPARIVTLGTTHYNRVSDAFLAIQLAEIGIVGFLLFVGSLIEILYLRSRLGALVIAGLLVLMVGTDVPDMGTYYWALIVMLVLLIKKELGTRPRGELSASRDR